MANNNIGPKRLVVGAHYGLKDWLAQRVTAVIMVVFTVVLAVAFLLSNGASRVDRHSRHLDGLCKADGRAPRAASSYDPVSRRLCGLRCSDSLEGVINGRSQDWIAASSL